MSRESKRFTPSKWTNRLVPIFLAILVIGLLLTLVVIGLSIAGLTPAY